LTVADDGTSEAATPGVFFTHAKISEFGG